MNGKPKLTEKQTAIYEFIAEQIRVAGYPPTIREIAATFGYSSLRTVQVHLDALERKGWVRRREGRSRGLELMEPDPEMLPVLGRISAGSPLLAIENREGELPIRFKAGGMGGRFALRVSGNSMVGAGIYDGDYCIVKITDDVRPGMVVVAVLGEEATVKRFKGLCDDGMVLLPENPEFEPIVCNPGEVRICGVVEGVWRDIK